MLAIAVMILVGCSSETVVERKVFLPPLEKDIENVSDIARDISKTINSDEKVQRDLGDIIDANENLNSIYIGGGKSRNIKSGVVSGYVKYSLNLAEINPDKISELQDILTELITYKMNLYFINEYGFNYDVPNQKAFEFVRLSFLNGRAEGYSFLRNLESNGGSENKYKKRIELMHGEGYPRQIELVGSMMMPQKNQIHTLVFGKNEINQFIYLITINYDKQGGYQIHGFNRLNEKVLNNYVNYIRFEDKDSAKNYFSKD